jgi:hypothetical protein
MTIFAVCPTCGSNLKAPDDLLGKTVKCPRCGASFTITAEDSGLSPGSLPPVGVRSTPQLERSSHRAPSAYDEDEAVWGEDDDDDRAFTTRRYRRSHLKPGSGFGVAALVLGIVSLPLICLCGLLAAPLSILAVIFGAIGIGREGRGLAIAGLVLGSVSLILTIAVLIIGLAMFGAPGRLR